MLLICSTPRKTIVILFAVYIIIMNTAYCTTITITPGQKIQEAIDSALPGDIIQVMGGIYFENLVISKNLILKGINDPLIDAQANGSAIIILADRSIIIGFNVTNSSDSGIEIRSNDNLISNNTADNGHDGIVLDAANNNTVLGNIFRENQKSGICLEDSMNNTLMDNRAENNHDTGIELEDSANNYIFKNVAVNNSNDGIELQRSTKNKIEGNLVLKNKDGICLEDESKNNTISKNTANNNYIDGILVRNSLGNIISLNVINGSSKGIFFEASRDNIIRDNNVINNMDGVFINYYSSDNQIYRNNLMGSLNYNAYDESNANRWDDGTSGNYYSDYDKKEKGCIDADMDGKCDSPYAIPGGTCQDRYPLASSPKPE